jgi:hypothetical protein
LGFLCRYRHKQKKHPELIKCRSASLVADAAAPLASKRSPVSARPLPPRRSHHGPSSSPRRSDLPHASRAVEAVEASAASAAVDGSAAATAQDRAEKETARWKRRKLNRQARPRLS